MIQLLVEPIKSFVLHGDRPAVRFVVEAAEELIGVAGVSIEFGDALHGGLHSVQGGGGSLASTVVRRALAAR